MNFCNGEILSEKANATLNLAHEGYYVFPVPVGSKKSHKSEKLSGSKWGMTREEAQIRRDWEKWPEANIGVPCGEQNGIFVLDLDCKDGVDGVAWLRSMEARHGALPKTVRAQSPTGGLHIWFAYPDFEVRNSASALAPGVDIRGEGGMVVVPPSEKPDGSAYKWIASPHDIAIADAPEWLLTLLRDHEASRNARTHAERGADWPPITSKGIQRQIEMAARKVAMAAPGERNDTLNRQAYWLGQAVGGGWMDSAKVQDALTEAAIEAGLGLDEVAQTLESGLAAGARNPRPAAAPPEFEHGHDALARQLGAWGWNDDAKYVDKLGSWFLWDGKAWRRVEKREEFTRVRDFIAERVQDVRSYAEDIAPLLTTDADRKKMRQWAKAERARLQDAQTIAAVERLARSNKASAVVHDDFDADPSLLGTPGGVVDLRTGMLRPAQRSDMISKLTAVAPGRIVPHRWLRFLDEVFGGDPEMIEFIQRLAGYALTGETREHKLPFATGGGRNGKSVLLETWRSIWGDYGGTASASIFLNTKNPQHQAPIAAMRGKRLIVASELFAGAVWNDALVKSLTGGDTISANEMRKDPIEFKLNATIIIAGNNTPNLPAVDRAMRDRLMLIPFNVTFTDDADELGKPGFLPRDNHLTDELRKEYPAILQWAIEGAVKYYASGLKAPASVTVASADYMDEQDLVLNWIAEECERVPGEFLANEPMLARFNDWLTRQGFHTTFSQRWLTQQLKQKGLVPGKARQDYREVRGVHGLRLREHEL
ncbi:phage/plasmid primase, P4 family [Paracoccus niistensis]|uniref:Phage/plasmid primase, P4 family n=1 Tax=Paracoccus niistensis TaxID=632935 RepID=A0ABV6I3I0_9RHOB